MTHDPKIDVSVGRFTAGSITLLQPQQLVAERALDGILLTLPCQIQLDRVSFRPMDAVPAPKTAAVVLTRLRAAVRWRGLFIGMARSEYDYRSNPAAQLGHLRLHLPASSIWHIERDRDGDDVAVDVEIRGDLHVTVPFDNLAIATANGIGNIVGAPYDYISPPSPVAEGRKVTYPAAAWVDMLQKTGLGENVVVEIPLPPAPPDDDWKEVWKHLRAARDALAHGGATNWGHVVVESRKALEVWQGIEAHAIMEDPNRRRRDRDDDERLRSIRRYLHEFAHLSAHPGAFAATRDDAVLVLSTVAALLARRNP